MTHRPVTRAAATPETAWPAPAPASRALVKARRPRAGACRLAALAAGALALLAAAPAARAQAGFAAPPYADAGVATTDDASALFVNPSAAGLRRGFELAVSASGVPRPAGGDRGDPLRHPFYRAALALGLAGFTLASPEGGRVSWAVSAAHGGPALRVGAQLQSLGTSTWLAQLDRLDPQAPASVAAGAPGDARTTDLRLGALSRPAPWLSLGAVVDHAAQPRLAGVRLVREYTVGLGLRPFAWLPGSGSTLGTRVTLGADVALREGESRDAARVRVGAGFELVPGIVLRGAVEDHGGVRLGISLLGGRSSLHVDSQDCRDCRDPAGTITATVHAAEDRTVLAALERPRVASVRIGGTLADEAIASVSLFDNSTTVDVAPVRRQLERALLDPRTRGVLLQLNGAGGMAQIEELRPRIAALRAAGKPVVAYLESGGRRADLYFASACNAIVTTPESFWAGLGLHSDRRYYRKALADAGLRIDRTSYGKYKSAYRNFSADSTSPADRESIEHGLDVVQGLLVTAVAHDRRIPEERVLQVLDGRSWRAEDLQRMGVIDSIGYREDALRMLGSLAHLGARPHAVNLGRIEDAHREWRVPHTIAVVYASGGIETGRSGNDLLNGAFMGSETTVRQLAAAFRNPEVRAVVLRVDSPGGSAVASDLIWHAARQLKRETRKPLVVSMARAAASGGYHIALAGDRIYADRFTITGSIGVLSIRYSFEGWLAHHHVHQDDFNRGAYMRAWSTGHDWDATEQAAADSATYADYRSFVSVVAEGRGMAWDAVDAVAQGRVWFGEDAKQRGLVDAIGGLDDAIAEARRRAGIPVGARVEPVEYRRPRPGLAQALLGSWVREQWQQSVHLPDAGETRFGTDPDALSIE